MGSGSSKGPSRREGGGGGLGQQDQGALSSATPSPPGTASPGLLLAGLAQEDKACSPSPSPPSPDPDLELLQQVLEEFGEGGGDDEEEEEEDDDDCALQELRLSPGGHFPLRLDAGDLGWRPPQDGVSSGAEGTRPQEEKLELPQKAARPTPESNNFANQVPPKDPDRLAKIAYDYSEEELMATIEQEYCR